jgi:hypothetical protein
MCVLCGMVAAARAQVPALPPADEPAPAASLPMAGQPDAVVDATDNPAGCPPEMAAESDWLKVPPVRRYPSLGMLLFPPAGPGYYSLQDCLQGHWREGPPKYPYARFGIIPPSFFDADFRYLDRPDNEEYDYFDPLKRVHLGDDFLFSTGGDVRTRYSSETNSRLTGTNNVYELFRVRTYGDLWYRDRLRLYAEFLYAESFNQDLAPLPIDVNRGDLLNLFVDVKVCNLCDGSVYFRGGRQELLYGSQRLISTLDWANTRRTFQGAKLFYTAPKWDVDLFCVQPVIVDPERFDSVDNNQVFTGFWTTYRPKDGQAIDGYYLNLDNASPVASGEGGVLGAQNISTLGGRYFGNVNNWLCDLEGAIQFGTFSNQGTLAKAFTTGFGYHFKDVTWTPQVWVYYDYASGDPNPGVGGTQRTFNPLFPFGHYYFGYIDAVGRQNINDFSTQVAFYPAKWITTFVQFHVFRLDSPRDALYNAAGRVLRRDPTGLAGEDVGQEIDVLLNFHLTKHQDIFLTYSHLFPGEFLRRTGNGGSADYLYVQHSYRW